MQAVYSLYPRKKHATREQERGGISNSQAGNEREKRATGRKRCRETRYKVKEEEEEYNKRKKTSSS